MVASAFGDGVDGVLGVHFWFIGGVGGVYKSGVVGAWLGTRSFQIIGSLLFLEKIVDLLGIIKSSSFHNLIFSPILSFSL